jgi:hypothetical protein
MAKGAGFNSITVIKNEERIVPTLTGLGKGCHFVKINVLPGNAKVKNIPLNPVYIKERFMGAISK